MTVMTTRSCHPGGLMPVALVSIPLPGGLSLTHDAGCGLQHPEPGPPELPLSGTQAP